MLGDGLSPPTCVIGVPKSDGSRIHITSLGRRLGASQLSNSPSSSALVSAGGMSSISFLAASMDSRRCAQRYCLRPTVVLKTVLGYLVLNYWGHYSGWPDLLVYRANQWFLAEVKSWCDKLNENQKRWIQDNHRYLHLPFKLVQVAQGGV